MRAELKVGALRGLRALRALRVVHVVGLLALGLLASCYESTEDYGGDSHFLRPCQRQAQCDDLGEGYTCEDGHCRAPSATTVADAGTADARSAVGTGRGEGGNAAPSDSTPGAVAASSSEQVAPLVLFLIDTSGSSERVSDCTCDDLACMNCLPLCHPANGDPQRNRWTQLLEALTGTFSDFSCEPLERTPENGATYDVGYYLPYHRPAGEQDDDGVLDVYRDRLRFGVATFDSWDTYVGADRLIPLFQFDVTQSRGVSGLWSYIPELEIEGPLEGSAWPIGLFRYPNCTQAYFMDSGIRSAQAAEGALRVASDPARAAEVNDAIQHDLLQVRPYGGTPIAAALDDLYYVLKQDPLMAPERARDVPRHVVLITDGEPDADYRDLGCDCNDRNEGDDPERCGPPPNDPATMHCPYPTAAAAAHALRCGKDGLGCEGPATALHVIGFGINETTVVERLDEIAVEGGTERSRIVADGVELRRELMDLLDTLER